MTDQEKLKSGRFKWEWQWQWRLLPSAKWRRAVW